MPPERAPYDLFPQEAHQAVSHPPTPLEKLHRVARSVMHLQDVPTLALAVTSAMEDYLDVWMGVVEEDEVLLYAYSGVHRFRIGQEGLIGWVAAHGKPLLVNDVTQDPRYVVRGIKPDPTRSELVVPIMLDESVIGVLDFHEGRPGAFTEADVQFAESLASFLAVAIRNARLYAQSKTHAERIALVADVAAELNVLQSVSDALKNSARVICDRLNYINVAIGLVEGDELVFKVDYDTGVFRSDEVLIRQPLTGEGVTVNVVTSGEPRLIHDTRTVQNYVSTGNAMLSELAVPIRSGTQTIGVLNVESPKPGAFDETDLQIMQTVADQVAVAIENARLYQKVQETQAQFVRNERLRAVGELAGGVAHNFNNVLTGILGYAELLMMDTRLAAYQDPLETIIQSAKQGASIAKRLQEFTRVKTNASMTAVNLNTVIEQALLITRPRWKDTAEAAGCRIEAVMRLQPLPAITGNESELMEVFTNLILNAVDAMPEGGTLTISTRTYKRVVEAQVADTGVGMDAFTQTRIFEPFFTTKGPQLGTGFGLSVSHSIMQRHNGDISVKSAPGEGATFTLRFPVHTGPEISGTAVEPRAVLSQRILVIDDEEKIQHLLAEMLKEHTVRTASSGEAGLEMFQEGEYDLVFTDIGMPGLSGWDVAAAIHRMAPATVVIAVTGWGDEAPGGMTAGRTVDFILSKPFTLQDLRQVLGRAVDLRRERAGEKKNGDSGA